MVIVTFEETPMGLASAAYEDDALVQLPGLATKTAEDLEEGDQVVAQGGLYIVASVEIEDA